MNYCMDCRHCEPDKTSVPVIGLPDWVRASCKHPKSFWLVCADARQEHPTVKGGVRYNYDAMSVQEYNEAEMRAAECGPEGKLFEAKP